jgi:uncharacterized membrane protein YagU involved in acid resistance
VIARGIAAGILGTAAMTAAQVLPSGGSDDDSEPSWDEAPVPAQVARKIGEGVFGRKVSAAKIPLLTNVMHWGYGTGWGVVYSAVRRGESTRPLRTGLLFGLGVWAMSYVQLVPMGLYEPPWEYSPKDIAMEVGYHVAYGAGVGVGHHLS